MSSRHVLSISFFLGREGIPPSFHFFLLNKNGMVLIFIFFPHNIGTFHFHFSADCPFSFSHFYASLLQLALSHCLISFVLVPCLSPVHLSLTLSCSLLDHTLILCDVKLITLPLFFSAPLPLSVPLWCESDYSGWRI